MGYWLNGCIACAIAWGPPLLASLFVRSRWTRNSPAEVRLASLLIYLIGSAFWLWFWDRSNTRTREPGPLEIAFVAGIWAAPFLGLLLITFGAIHAKRDKARRGLPA